MYPTATELAEDSEILAGVTGPKLEALRRLAIRKVERFTGQTFEPSTEDVVMDGTGGPSIYPPKRVEVLAGILVKGTDMDLTDVSLLDGGKRIVLAPMNLGYAVQAMREHAYDTRTFRSGEGTIVLSGTFGWTTPPPELADALTGEMENEHLAKGSALAPTVAAYRRLGLTDISQGNLRATIGDPSLVRAETALLLADLVWLGPGGYLV
jgi:hypothetical protein